MEIIKELRCPRCDSENIKVFDAYGDEIDLNARLENMENGDGRPIFYHCRECGGYYDDYIEVVE